MTDHDKPTYARAAVANQREISIWCPTCESRLRIHTAIALSVDTILKHHPESGEKTAAERSAELEQQVHKWKQEAAAQGQLRRMTDPLPPGVAGVLDAARVAAKLDDPRQEMRNLRAAVNAQRKVEEAPRTALGETADTLIAIGQEAAERIGTAVSEGLIGADQPPARGEVCSPVEQESDEWSRAAKRVQELDPDGEQSRELLEKMVAKHEKPARGEVCGLCWHFKDEDTSTHLGRCDTDDEAVCAYDAACHVYEPTPEVCAECGGLGNAQGLKTASLQYVPCPSCSGTGTTPAPAQLPDCDYCGRAQAQPGALVFSPPDGDGTCDKRHCCTGCFAKLGTGNAPAPEPRQDRLREAVAKALTELEPHVANVETTGGLGAVARFNCRRLRAALAEPAPEPSPDRLRSAVEAAVALLNGAAQFCDGCQAEGCADIGAAHEQLKAALAEEDGDG
jgi:hypothetical protein